MKLTSIGKFCLFPALAALLVACGGSGGPNKISLVSPSTGTGFDGTVISIAPAKDGSNDIYVAGDFDSYDGTAVHGIARLNSDGALDTTFSTGSGANSTVRAIAVSGDGSGDIYIVGDFTSYNGKAISGIARLNSDGSLDAGFNIGTGFNAFPDCIALAADGSGDVYVGGNFTLYRGNTSNRIVRINSNGSFDSAFNTGSGLNGTVSALIPLSDGDVYAAGSFTAYRGNTSNRIVRINGDGSFDGTFNTGTGFDGAVSDIAVDSSNGAIYAAGSFTTYRGDSRKYLARINRDGSDDTGFNTGTGFNGKTLAVVVDSIGGIYVGGSYTNYNGNNAMRIVRIYTDGSVDSTFTTGAGFDNTVFTIAPLTDGSGDIYVGGDFTTYNSHAAGHIVHLQASGTRD